ncbi:hypothetical protein EIN_487280 [Entamoeba invadens IP1]|uniref:Uncharacterized protein n=1 Tax=Entamoeba invadens IP1 TaxID=370355 RepID=A0A0A1U4S9_ENTIV|nr:hypothetical protein EIN_487280 [Entamoeba invadens IP1]ELP89246.1 hypothetical protein EIN_487280 [Entamoeba invadens IP1]|eukprot:XP_004256017.1 hypothetical protein EIN_487280 [Entamoeba invadens IP1]
MLGIDPHNYLIPKVSATQHLQTIDSFRFDILEKKIDIILFRTDLIMKELRTIPRCKDQQNFNLNETNLSLSQRKMEQNHDLNKEIEEKQSPLKQNKILEKMHQTEKESQTQIVHFSLPKIEKVENQNDEKIEAKNLEKREKYLTEKYKALRIINEDKRKLLENLKKKKKDQEKLKFFNTNVLKGQIEIPENLKIDVKSVEQKHPQNESQNVTIKQLQPIKQSDVEIEDQIAKTNELQKENEKEKTKQPENPTKEQIEQFIIERITNTINKFEDDYDILRKTNRAKKNEIQLIKKRRLEQYNGSISKL